jgi:hypothetical protein
MESGVLMKKRYLYCLLFLAPGALLSLIAATAITGTTAGFLWIFVFGDNTWPTIVERGLALLFPLTFLGLWIAFVGAGFMTGKRLEVDPGLDKFVPTKAIRQGACHQEIQMIVAVSAMMVMAVKSSSCPWRIFFQTSHNRPASRL